MANGGKRPGAGRKPDITKQKIAEEYTKALYEAVQKEKLPIIKALIKRAKTGDVQAVKEIHERLLGKVAQALTGTDGNDLFPAPLLANLDVHNNNGHQKNSQSIETDTSSTGGNVSEQDNLDTLIPD